MLDKLERKIGKYAIPGLIRFILGGYAIGYLLFFIGQGFGTYGGVGMVSAMVLEPAYIIADPRQIYRLLSWVLVPPSFSNILFMLIMMLFYYQLGMALERIMGTFRFNVYIFGGIISTILGAFILYGVMYALGYPGYTMGFSVSTYYINMGIFLAFATIFPDNQVMLYFLIPIKMKWLAAVYAAFIIVDMINSDWGRRTIIIASLLNFIVFFLLTRNYSRLDPRERKRQADFRRAYRQGAQQRSAGFGGFGRSTNSDSSFTSQTSNDDVFEAARRSAASRASARHKCDICGRTEITNPELDFRFCSKCAGSHEYCNEHLFTHAHIQ